MENRPSPLIDPRKNQSVSGVSQKLIVDASNLPALLIPLLQAAQLHPQESRLNGIQASVVSFHLVDILPALPMIAKHAHLLGEQLIVRRNSTRFATRAEVLSRIKAKSRRQSHGSRPAP